METILSTRYANEIQELSQEFLDRFEDNIFEDTATIPIGTKEELIIVCRKIREGIFTYTIEDTNTIGVSILHLRGDNNYTLWINDYWKDIINDGLPEDTPTELPNPIHPNNIPVATNDSTIRFSGADWYEEVQKCSIILAGLGGIGSWVAVLLARLNPKELYLYDVDVVDSTNMSGQLYAKDQIGVTKREATVTNIYRYTNFTRFYTQGLYNENSFKAPIMICGFDNMRARKIFYKNWLNLISLYEESGYNKDKIKEFIFIDGRLAMESYQVFAITGDDERAKEIYERDWLFDDSEAEETICSMKQTSHMACMIASTMTNLLVNHIANQVEGVMPRDVPFMTEYNACNMYTKIIM